jgi:DNA-binding transcriptional MerR regulator
MATEKTLQDVSKEVGVSTDKVRYWLSLLEVPTEKRGRVVYLPEESARKLTVMTSMVAEGFSPAEAAKRARGDAVMVPVAVPTTLPMTDPGPRLEALEKAVMLLVEENRAVRQDNAAIRVAVERMADENRNLRLALLPPAEPPRQVIPWAPPPRPDPCKGQPWYRVLWWELVSPERFRCLAS